MVSSINVYTVNSPMPSFFTFSTSRSLPGSSIIPKNSPENRLPKCPNKSTPGKRDMTISDMSIEITVRFAYLMSSFFL